MKLKGIFRKPKLFCNFLGLEMENFDGLWKNYDILEKFGSQNKIP